MARKRTAAPAPAPAPCKGSELRTAWSRGFAGGFTYRNRRAVAFPGALRIEELARKVYPPKQEKRPREMLDLCTGLWYRISPRGQLQFRAGKDGAWKDCDTAGTLKELRASPERTVEID